MLKTIDRALRWSTGLMAAMALFSLMWLTLVDVTGRKFFSNSVPGGLEITEILMVIVIFGALPMVSWRGEHVVFDTLDSFIPDWLRDIQARVVHLICAATFGWLGRLMLLRAERFAEYGDTTVHLQLSIAPVAWLMAALLLLTGLVHLLFVFVKAPLPEHHPFPAAADRTAP
ncbi:MAG: TRAP transporter small permease subunit [Hydrogenophaga sp.]|jgi:TRAP-type C4-dicarboxylate transport system permease small subunit|uniref:TRAP transporter small permease n=1 Tax=Hydrogenophaga sp. TaxID=1904254 RepID=UPI0027273D0F|nr:TRAP transporter small permease subunit [Hydrogenophaga sp.]MDO8887786.1 TRAP transporter small permease subunit [Hydrogenophaga sp.]MDP1685688.1 TRAP transporter small permease subunit [Hydrogenophaga sp.]MDP1783070.1 TRAP transporter small permease subunit [Hydrogenophaga sp.]MDP2075194.1 TRAP transporter small permease subunit [Hydrogenophaga sp.]MDP3109939.1 TRAP transporter small permease subunit [Hydrogenophaga sp.]